MRSKAKEYLLNEMRDLEIELLELKLVFEKKNERMRNMILVMEILEKEERKES